MNFNLLSKRVYSFIQGQNLSCFLRSKTILVMKLIAILLTVACLQVSAEGFSQQITLSKNNASLKSVLQDIRKQSGYQLLYNTDLIQKAKPVSINVHNSGIEEALKQSLKGQAFTYEITDKIILIKPVTAAGSELNMHWKVLKQIRGKVITADGHPLPGVVITEKGTTNKTATNGEGEFELRNAADDAVLVFSYIGYQSQEIATKGATGPLNVTLIESDNKLSEVNIVVSTGYQNLPKERATGSFSFVDQKKLGITNLASTDFAKGLEGLVPGLLVGPTGTMQIRGASSLRPTTREVLIVVDGFPIESGNFTVNPNDIESISVLKDAAAASIWGVRASNGVVVIKTKSGMANDGKAVFNFTSNLSVANKPDFSFQRLASSADYIDAEVESIGKGWINFNNADKTPYSLVAGLFYQKSKGLLTDDQVNSGLAQLKQYNSLNEQDLFYRRAVQRQLNLSVRGGTEKYQFAISSLYTNELTNLVGKNNDNLILNFKNSLQVLPRVVLSLGINSTYAKSNGSNIGYDYDSARPYNRILDENGNYVSRTSRVPDHMKQSFYNNGYLNWDDNALQNMQNTTTKKNTFASRINLGADYEIIKGLNFSSQFQMELRYTNDENLQGIGAYYPRLMANTWRVSTTPGTFVNKFPIGPVFDKGKENQNSWTFRNVANLNRQFGKDHAISAIAGMELRKIGLTSNTERYYNYNSKALTSDNIDLASFGINQPNAFGDYGTYTWSPNFKDTDRRFFSLFANAAYTYKNRYTVSGSIRTDESNLFGTDPKYRYRPLWSAGASWNMTNEDFMRSVSFLDKLIVRATYGVNGNIGNSSPYPIAQTGKNFNTQENMLTFSNPENQALRPEKTASTNFGIDFAVLNHRVSGSVDLYKKKSYDLLASSILDPTTGFVSAEKNTASMTNHGIELNLNARILEGDVRLDADFNFGYNKNKVTDVLTPNKTASAYADAIGQIAGLPLSYLHSYKWAGLSSKGEPQIYNADGSIRSWSAARITDINALAYVGTMDPPVYGGMMVNLGYKGFTFTPQFTFKMGHVMRMSTTKTDLTAGVTYDIANRWKNPGDELHTNIPTLYSKSTIDAKWNDYYRKSDVWNDDASFVRLRSLSLSYQMPKKFLFNVFTAASLTAQANNVWLWAANKQGLDPDYVNLLTGSIGFPPVKNYVFSLNLNF
jgi:TonB-linked SusC/RagA family outer membrane protein